MKFVLCIITLLAFGHTTLLTGNVPSDVILKDGDNFCAYDLEVNGDSFKAKIPGCHVPRLVQHIEDLVQIVEQPRRDDYTHRTLVSNDYLEPVTPGCFNKGALYRLDYQVAINLNGEVRPATYQVFELEVEEPCELGKHR